MTHQTSWLESTGVIWCVHLQVDKDLRVMLVKPDAPAPKTIDVTVWRRAIPQFNIHHLDDVQVGADLALLHATAYCVLGMP